MSTLRSTSPLTGFFRLMLALLVVLQHAATSVLPVSFGQAITPLELGSLAVLLFFIASGFIITQVAHTTYDGRPTAFIINRLLRLLPSYGAALVLTLALIAGLSFVGITGPIATQLAQTPGQPLTNLIGNAIAILPGSPIVMGTFSVHPVLDLVWALRIELLFYAIVGLALAIHQRLAVPLKRVLALVALASLLIYLPLIERWHGGSFEYVPYFVLGAAVYFVTVSPHNRVWPIAIALTAAVAVALHQVGRAPVHEAGFARNLFAQYALLALGTGVWLALIFNAAPTAPSLEHFPTEVVPGSAQKMRQSTELEHRADRVSSERALAHRDQLAGEYTYPLYLVHVAALVGAQALFPSPGWLASSTALALSFALAYLLILTIERPIARLRARVRRRSEPQPRGVAQAISL